ncbi:putative reverse transcriptase domain-containing protein [Tanacetum coccineum]
MPPRMTTQSAGRSTAALRGGRTGRRTGGGGGRTREPTGRQLQNLLPTIIAQVGNHASNIQGDVKNVSMNNNRGGCSYKEFLSCNPKDYDGKGGAIVYTRWTKKMELVHDMSGHGDNQKVKHTAGSFIDSWDGGSNRANDNSEAILKAGVLTDEAIRNGSLKKKNTKKIGNGGEPSMDGNVRDNNNRSRTGRAFATTTNPVRKEYIDSRQLIEINKVICGCKLEIKGHTFDIDLIPYGHRSFDVIVGMDWLSRHKAEIVCHEKVVRIPLPHSEMLRVMGEWPE